MQIVGIGSDIIEIERVKEIVEKNSRFLIRVYTEKEIEYLKIKSGYSSHAGRFAAKEAVAKAIGSGISGFAFKDIEILNDKNGKPYVKLYGNAVNIAKGLTFLITISHSRDYATATCIAVKLEG